MIEGLVIGDIVVLKSGGPQMVVTGIGALYSEVTCCWFDPGNYVYNSYDFPIEALSKSILEHSNGSIPK